MPWISIFSLKKCCLRESDCIPSPSTRKLDSVAKFISWFDKYELGGPDDDDVDNIIGDPNYVPTQ